MDNYSKPKWFTNLWWENIGNWYSWILLKLYILCLEHSIDTDIIIPEIKNWELKIQINWLVSTDFLIWVHWLENEARCVCRVCWMSWKNRTNLQWIYCLYHNIKTNIIKTIKLFLLNFK